MHTKDVITDNEDLSCMWYKDQWKVEVAINQFSGFEKTQEMYKQIDWGKIYLLVNFLSKIMFRKSKLPKNCPPLMKTLKGGFWMKYGGAGWW